MKRIPAIWPIAATALTLICGGGSQAASDFGHRSDAYTCFSTGLSDDDIIKYCWQAVQSGLLTRSGFTVAVNNIGVAFMDKNDYKTAINFFTAGADHSTFSIFVNRGECYRTQQNYDLALADFNKAIEIAPHEPIAYRARAGLYATLNKPDLAIADFTSAISLDAKDAKALYFRSLVKRDTGDVPGADADLNAAQAINPTIVSDHPTTPVKSLLELVR